jgi:hypothetical protein
MCAGQQHLAEPAAAAHLEHIGALIAIESAQPASPSNVARDPASGMPV